MARAQTRAEIIRGRITTDSGVAIPDATVLATMAPDRVVFEGRADAAGRYELVIPGGTGDYLVHISAPGRRPYRKRVVRSAGESADGVFTVDAALAPVAPQQLAAVRVQGKKPKPDRAPDPGTEPGAAQALTDDFAAAVPPDVAGDLAARAATVPGVMPVTGGVSVHGLPPEQNTATLNGLAFGASALPRAAPVRVRVSTTAYDPARGWFGGANTDVEFGSGSIYSTRSAYVTLDAPFLQYGDPVSSGLGQRVTGVNASLGGSGPLGNRDRYFYSYGAQAGRRVADVTSLVGAGADLMRRVGVSADSADRLLQLARTLGVPLAAPAAPHSLIADNLSLLARFDRAPFDWQTVSPSPRTAAVTVFGNWTRTAPLGLGVTATPAHASSQWQGRVGLQGLYSAYVGQDRLATLRTGLSFARARVRPYLPLPEAAVVVTSAFNDSAGGADSGDGAVSTATLLAGGTTAESDRRQWTWEATGQSQRYARGRSSHRLTLTAGSRLDGYADHEVEAPLGRFAFNSLADFAGGRPASFTRSLAAPPRRGGEWNGFVALGDLWRASQGVRIEYGLRAEGNVFTSRPAFNPTVARLLGARTDVAPNTWHLSPRAGFTWARRGGGNAGRVVVNPLGAFNAGPSSYVRGGLGEFRSMMPVTLLSDAQIATGLPGASRTLTCLGSAVPTPDWRAYGADAATVPRECAAGSADPAVADTAPDVRLVDPSFTPARSWRANLAYASRYRRLTYSIEGVYSLNLNQPGRIDLNFRDVPAFTTPDEGRPVFVPAPAIDPASGAVPAAPSRATPSLGRVLSSRSDLRSVGRQTVLTVAPDFAGVKRWWGSLSYVLGSVRALQSGFDGTTFRTPIERTWERGSLDARHQLLLRAGYTAGGVSLSLFGRVTSGLPFTPTVGGDVNGDGLLNDRAFIADSASGSDAGTASALKALVASSSPSVRECLVRQRNSAARGNSCESPWTTALNAQVTLDGASLHLGRHIGFVRLNLANPLGGLDQLLHGSARLRGWGTQPVPDQVLYHVAGFDPVARRFRYRVNPRFGKTDPALTTVRAPFRVTLDASVNLSRDFAQQQLERYLGPGRAGRPGTRLGVPELKRRYEREVPDPYAAILQESDSLLLSPAQVEALQRADVRYAQRMDSLWLALASDFSALGDKYDVETAVHRQEEAIDAGWEITRVDVRATLGSILSPIQLRLMPSLVSRLYAAEGPVRRRGRTLAP